MGFCQAGQVENARVDLGKELCQSALDEIFPERKADSSFAATIQLKYLQQAVVACACLSSLSACRSGMMRLATTITTYGTEISEVISVMCRPEVSHECLTFCFAYRLDASRFVVTTLVSLIK